MAITVLEELQILKGTVGPGVLLIDLVHQIAMGEGVQFHIDYKIFDGGTNIEAQSYLDKVLGVINRVYDINNQTVQSLQKLEVSLIGNSAVTWQQVQDATDEQWETFIIDNMLRTFELLGRVLKSEKTAYDEL